MFQEYAVEPGVVVEQCALLRAFIGVTHARLVLRFPKKWETEVLRLADDLPDVKRAQVVELLRRLKPYARRPDAVFEREHTWLQNAEAEHARKPLAAILAQTNPQQKSGVKILDFLTVDDPLFQPARTFEVRREAEAMSRAIAPLLRISKKLVFIDPYFQPAKEGRWQASISAMLHAALEERTPGSFPAVVEVHASETAKDVNRTDFAADCRLWEELVPRGITVRFRLLRDKGNGPTLHDRFVLTDQAVVQFSHGLDQGANSREQHLLTVLDEQAWNKVYEKHLAEFGPKGSFDEVIPGGVLVVGAK